MFLRSGVQQKRGTRSMCSYQVNWKWVPCTISNTLSRTSDQLFCSVIIYLAVFECKDVQNHFLIMNALNESTELWQLWNTLSCNCGRQLALALDLNLPVTWTQTLTLTLSQTLFLTLTLTLPLTLTLTLIIKLTLTVILMLALTLTVSLNGRCLIYQSFALCPNQNATEIIFHR